MIENDVYPTDIAYRAIHQQLMDVIDSARKRSNRKLMWRAARSLIGVEKMMGTELRFSESMHQVAIGKGVKTKRRALGDIIIIISAHQKAMKSVPTDTKVGATAYSMIGRSLKILMSHMCNEQCVQPASGIELCHRCGNSHEKEVAL